jgi:metal-dependent amidase/aminoacylase/carboxypeptidase family protein
VNLQGGNILEKYKVIDKVKDIKSIIDDLSIKIWENPEIAGEEKYASALFKDILKIMVLQSKKSTIWNMHL